VIDKGASAEYSQVEMLLRALCRKLRPKAVLKLKLDPSDPSMFIYDKLRQHVLDKCVTTNALGILVLEGALTAPGVSPHSVLLYGGVRSSSRVCAGVCEGVSIVSCNETCRIDIRSIDD